MTLPTDPNPYAAPATVTDSQPKPLPYSGSILAQGWEIFAGHWGTIAIVMLIVWVPASSVTSYVTREVIGDSDSLLTLLLIPIEFIAESLATGAVIAVAIVAAMGKPPRLADALRTSLRVWPVFLWTYFWCTVFIVIGAMALLLPGIFLAIRLSMADYVVVNERVWGLAAMQRSFALTAGRFWPLARLCLLLFLLSAGSWTLYSLLDAFVPAFSNWQIEVLATFMINIIEAYPAICVYLCYRRFLNDAAIQIF